LKEEDDVEEGKVIKVGGKGGWVRQTLDEAVGSLCRWKKGTNTATRKSSFICYKINQFLLKNFFNLLLNLKRGPALYLIPRDICVGIRNN
jgi:hypothetical protein